MCLTTWARRLRGTPRFWLFSTGRLLLALPNLKTILRPCVTHLFFTLLTIGADFISAGVKLATYILCLCLIWSCKKAGRVTSSVQWLFWFFLVICQGFTFGSVVNHDLSAVHVLSSRFSGFYLDFT